MGCVIILYVGKSPSYRCPSLAVCLYVYAGVILNVYSCVCVVVVHLLCVCTFFVLNLVHRVILYVESPSGCGPFPAFVF